MQYLSFFLKLLVLVKQNCAKIKGSNDATNYIEH